MTSNIERLLCCLYKSKKSSSADLWERNKELVYEISYLIAELVYSKEAK